MAGGIALCRSKRWLPWTALDNQGELFEILCADNVELVLSELGTRWPALRKITSVHSLQLYQALCSNKVSQTTPYSFNAGRGTRGTGSSGLQVWPCFFATYRCLRATYVTGFFPIMSFQWYFLSNQNLMKCNSKAWIFWIRGFPCPGCSMKAWGTKPIWL